MKRVAIPLLLLAATACQTPQWPVNGPIRSPYGIRIAGIGGELHRGVDIGVAIGTPVRPMLNGRVRFAGTMSGYGQVIWVDHGEDVLTVYAHLSEIAVEAGREVSRGTVIGRTGQSGNTSGPHLHLEVWRWGREVDPVRMLGGPPGV